MSHYNRRSSIDKFNNRPPFDIKKMDDATSTENKEQGVPLCNNCEKAHMNTAAKSYISVARYLEQFGDKYQIYKCNKNKKIIPKIIESFQKVTPKKNTKKAKLKKKSESLETLFRNNKQISGKILPNHKIMKDLLKNFDGENAMEKAVSYEQIDMIPSKDTSTYPSDNHRTLRVDKGTSTTGLQWPIIRSDTEGSRIMSDRSKCNEANNNSDRKLNSKSPQKKELRVYNSCKFVNHVQLKNNIHRKKSSDSSDLEYFPSKENPLKKSDPVSKIPLQMFKMTNNLKMAMEKEFPNYKCNSNPGNIKKENTYVLYTDKSEETRKKQKSFVQLQVEKFNKRNNCRNVQYRGKSLKMTDAQSKRKNMSKRYMALMNSVRDTLPKMDETLVSDSVNENHEWSDTNVNCDTQVRFPKETRNAMEHLLKNLKKVPLTQYVKNQDLHIRPAIPVNRKPERRDCSVTRAGGTCHKKPSPLPCSRNLSYQRINHDGTPTRLETSLLPRYINSRRSRTNTKGF